MTGWRLIDSGPAAGAWNLALDDAIFAAVRDGASPPTLRLYAWSPPALTIGYGQDRDRDVDLEACAARGVEVLRRSTGGRAVLHDRDVTYSVAVPAGLPPFGRTLDEACRAVAEGILAALRRLGVAAARRARAPRSGSGERPADCFAAAARHEIEAGGRKIVGSAQRREGGAFLQHGSIRLAGGGRGLAPLLRGAARGPGGGAGGGGPRAAPASPGDLLAALARGGELAWGARFTRGGPSRAERELADRLERERYRSPAWNAGASRRPAAAGREAPPRPVRAR